MRHTHAHRFRHTFATWAIENHAPTDDGGQILVTDTVRNLVASKVAAAHASFSPAARLLAGGDAAG